jgi:hypothetical protein
VFSLIKKILHRGLRGIIPTIAYGYLITVFTSLIFLDGQYVPVVQILSAQFENEIYAVLLQIAFFALIGFVYGAASLIWDIDEWSYMKQTGIYFSISSITVLPVAYLMHWMPRNLIGFIVFFSIFTVMFFIVWCIQFSIWKAKIRKIDDELTKHKSDSE